MSYKIHGYFIGDEELNDERDFRCEWCGSNVIWTRYWRDYIFRERWDLRYECQSCGTMWWAELEHTVWLSREAYFRLTHGLPDPQEVKDGKKV